MTRTVLPALLSAALASAMLVACNKPQPAADAGTPTPPPAMPVDPASAAPATADVHAFRIGALQAYALKDGDIDAANDGKTFAIGEPIAAVSALLAAAGQPTDVLHLSLQPLLVRSDDRVLLFDTGAADASFARAGKLPASLRAAGVEPAQVTDIFISHKHADHVGGLVAKDGTLAFPNATVHLSAPEWQALQGESDAAALVAAIAPKVAAFAPGAQLIPGVVKAVTDNGHTPGHSAYEIGTGADRLLYIGDTAHHFVVSVQRPEWTLAYDENAPLAQTRRRALLQRAADEKLRVYAVHFPFPGLGRIEAKGDAFAWVPER